MGPGGRVSLNVDLGELPDEPAGLYALATVVNIACGGHAGDRESMQRACAAAVANGARIAAHPSYADREGFGRRTLGIAPEALRASVAEQCTELREIARLEGAAITAVKPHGALYHDATRDELLARAVVLGAYDALGGDAPHVLTIVGPPSSRLREEAARHRSQRYAAEGFADRTYDESGSIVPRSRPDALITDPALAAAQAVHLATTRSIDTVCVHGDTAFAEAIARAVREALQQNGLLE